jgi:CubicO group peptidase (beta-lactamase class C family)
LTEQGWPDSTSKHRFVAASESTESAVPRRLPAALLLMLLLAAAASPLAPAAAQEPPADRDGPVVGMPPPSDAVAGWVATWLDPDFWSAYVRQAILDGHVNLPYPTDPVKPEAYLPNVPVPPGAHTSALPVEPVGLSGLTYEWQGETKTVEQFLTTTRTDVVVLAVDGTVVGEWYRNGYAPDVRHQPWSVTKTFVAAVVGVAHGEGRIGSLDDPIESYIDELAGTAWEGVTIEQLLQMESGVHWDEDTPVLAINTQVEQWRDLALDLHTDGQLGATRNEFLAALPASYEPGTRFRYNSGNTQVLAWLTEVLYDQPFQDVLAEKLWQPMGAAGDAVLTADRVGGVIASHGLFARPHDFVRFGELLRNGGRTPEGRQVVPESWVDAMVTMTDTSGGRYGYQTWAHPTAGDGAYSASGFQGQKITVVPDACVTGVRLSHALGARVRDGEVTDPDAYGFGTEFFSEEWQTLLRAFAEEHGGCSRTPAEVVDRTDDASGDSEGPEGSGTPSSDGPGAPAPGRALPATGGGAPVAGLLLLGAAGLLCRPARRRAARPGVRRRR